MSRAGRLKPTPASVPDPRPAGTNPRGERPARLRNSPEAGHPRRSGKRRAPARLAGWCGPCPISLIQAGIRCGGRRLRVRTSAVQRVIVIGGGLAGSEAALLLAEAGVRVVLVEQKPVRRSPAHKSD